MIQELEVMMEELTSLLGAKEKEYLLADYCPERIKNSIFNLRNDIIAFRKKVDTAIADMAVRKFVVAEYSTDFNRIKTSIEKIRIK